jgi:hypothetical protein
MTDENTNTSTAAQPADGETACGCGPGCNCGDDCACGPNATCAPACNCAA